MVVTMGEWRECTLGELIANGDAELQTGPFGTMLNASEYCLIGVPVIAVQDIGENILRHEKLVFVNSETAERLKRYRVNSGDIIFGRKGAVDRRALIKDKESGWIQGSDCIRLRLSDNFNPRFVSYQFGTEAYKDWMMQFSTGATMPSLNQDILKLLPIIAPPLPVQRAIAEVLSSLDDKIDVLARQNATLEALAQTYFRQWFVNRDFPDTALKTYGDIVCGKTPSTSISTYFGGNIPFIKIPDMHGNIFIISTKDTLSAKGQQSQLKKTLPKGSICVSCIATVGIVSITTCDSQTNQQINSIVPRRDEYRYFLYLLMKNSFNELLAMASGGSVTNNLNTGDFSNMSVISPADKQLMDFDNIVRPLFEKVLSNTGQIKTLQKLRATLLPMLISGEVSVRL